MPTDREELDARKVLVTGGTSGPGLAMAAGLANAGATVALTGRSEERAREVAATGMVPVEQLPDDHGLIDPAVMGPPIVWLASAEAAGVHDERIVAIEFDDWLRRRARTSS